MRRGRRIEIVITNSPATERWRRREKETPETTANRLLRDMHPLDALNLARWRAKVHAPADLDHDALEDEDYLAAVADHDAKRSTESFRRWSGVVHYIKGRLTAAERRAAGYGPKRLAARARPAHAIT